MQVTCVWSFQEVMWPCRPTAKWWSLPLCSIIVRKQTCEKKLTIVTPRGKSLKINHKSLTTNYSLKDFWIFFQVLKLEKHFTKISFCLITKFSIKYACKVMPPPSWTMVLVNKWHQALSRSSPTSNFAFLLLEKVPNVERYVPSYLALCWKRNLIF